MGILDNLRDKAEEFGDKAKAGFEAAKDRGADFAADVKDRMDGDDAAADAPVADAPVADAPVADAPVADPPASDMAAADAGPGYGDHLSSAGDPLAGDLTDAAPDTLGSVPDYATAEAFEDADDTAPDGTRPGSDAV